MPSILIDSPRPDQDSTASVSGTDTDGTPFDTLAVNISVLIPTDEAAAWLALYDPASSTSPSAANSRIIARAVMDALAATWTP
jgi:hypothetical protein